MWIAMAAASMLAAQPTMPAWLAGSWKTAGTADEWSEEWWTPPRAGIMLGASRSGKAGVLGFFEHMRIVGAGPDLKFCAMPQGKAGTCFTAVAGDERHIVFENLLHDYPTRITYRREADGISAEISGKDGARTQRWRYVPISD